MTGFVKKEFNALLTEIKKLDRKSTAVFLTVMIFSTISWYFTSRRFFRLFLYDYFKFNENVDLIEFYYWFIGDTVSLFILPVIVIKFFLREKLSSYGLKAGDRSAGIKISVLFYIIMLPFLWIVTSYNSFQLVYPHIFSARQSWIIFLIYEAGIILYMFSWEFIWRGYMLFGLKEKFGYYAIFIQTIPFVILHNGKPAAETFGAIAAGLALGVLAFRTGSVFYGVIIHSSVMITIDLISVIRYRTGEYGIGINSLFNILKNITG